MTTYCSISTVTLRTSTALAILLLLSIHFQTSTSSLSTISSSSSSIITKNEPRTDPDDEYPQYLATCGPQTKQVKINGTVNRLTKVTEATMLSPPGRAFHSGMKAGAKSNLSFLVRRRNYR